MILQISPDNRITCPDCFGRKSNAGLVLDHCSHPQCHGNMLGCEYRLGCEQCYRGSGPCEFHTCRKCVGSGMVCPICRGDRIIRISTWDTGMYDVKLMRCDACCEGNQVNSIKEHMAIEAYVRKHQVRQFTIVEGGQPE